MDKNVIETTFDKVFKEYIPKKINDCRIEWQHVCKHNAMWMKTECDLRIVMYGRYGKRDDRVWKFKVDAKDGNPNDIEMKIKNELRDYLFEYLALANRSIL